MKELICHQLRKGNGNKQIICFPYLGGYANSFNDFTSEIEEDIDIWSINPPGHGRSTRDPFQDLKSMLDLYYVEIKKIIKPNAVFFGHSMGGIIAYFLAQKINEENDYPTKDITLVLSSCNTPYEFKVKSYSKLSNDDLIKQMIKYDGIPEQLIQERRLLEYFLPVFRADFKILENSANYRYTKSNYPVYFIWGDNDQIVPINAAFQWSKFFEKDIKMITIKNGNHMFIHNKANIVARHLEQIVNKSA